MSAAKRRVGEIVKWLDLRATGKWFVLSALIGIVAGLGATVFQISSHLVVRYTLNEFAVFSPGEASGEHSIFEHTSGDFNPWMIVGVMTVGGLLSGLLVYSFAPEAEGHGTDAAIDAFHNKRGQVRGRVPIIKTLASAITIGTGGSAGREGPIAQIGAGFGSFLATRLHLPARDRRIMVAAGMGAGIGAIFRAPLAGALFAGEILYGDADLESDVLVPAAISSIVGYSVFSLTCPGGENFAFLPLFGAGLHHEISSLHELLPLALLPFFLVLVGIVYIKMFYGTHALFQKLPLKPHFRPAVGAALAGLVGVGLFVFHGQNDYCLATLSTGYGALQTALEDPGSMGIQLLLLVAFGKIVTTSLTIGSGGSGGVFGPSMVIGGCVGAAVGICFGELLHIKTDPGAYAIVGMAGFFAGCAHAPISTIIMVSEMTGDYKLLVPTMWVSTLCFLLCRRWTLYQKQVPSRLDSPAHRGDFLVDILEGHRVADVYQKNREILTIPESMPLQDIVHRLAKTTQHYFPVVDANNRVVGIFSEDEVRSYLFDETIWHLAVARDVMTSHVVSVFPDDDLNTALRRLTSLNLEGLPILDPADPGHLLGMIDRKEMISFYNRRLSEHKQAVAD